jgi:hypothetical protein
MRRYFPYILSALVVAVALTGWLVATVYKQPDTPMPALDYADANNWALRPASAPTPVWTDGWALDFLVFHPQAEIKNTKIDPMENRARTASYVVDAVTLTQSELRQYGAVYMPLWIDHKSKTSALSDYLQNDNNGRAFFIVADAPLMLSDPDLLKAISSANASVRFGGIIAPETAHKKLPHAPMEHPKGTTCATFSEPTCVRLLEIDFRDKDAAFQDAAAATQLFEDYTEFLVTNVAPMAEPLGDFETINIQEIRNPGDTDEERAKTDADAN